MGYYDELFAQVKLPRMVRVTQRIKGVRLENVTEAVENVIDHFPGIGRVNGKSVALAVGSRGIDRLAELVRATVSCLKRHGARVYIVPAMGSHGGSRAEGQARLLRHLGITEEEVGAPVVSSMETVVVGYTEDGVPVHFDSEAAKADFTVSIARIKPHTSFSGVIESGMLKMNVIGLGKQRGADFCHSQGMDHMAENLIKVGRVSLEKSNLLFSIGLIENGRDEIAKLAAVPAEEIMAREPALLEEARSYMPGIPFGNLDVLIVDEFGKNITGTGMDSNVIQRFTNETIRPRQVTKRVVALRLTTESDGNATGCGLADISTRRMLNDMSFEKTYPNSITSRTVSGCRVPMIMETDYDAVRAGIKTAPAVDYGGIRMVRIRNTLMLEELEISEPLLAEALGIEDITVCSEPYEWAFDASGNLDI